jgi:hypothetical protein
MDQLIGNPCASFVIPYLDDIIIFSRNEEEHRRDLWSVFALLKKSNIILNKKKCKFFKEEIKILGNIISQGYRKPDPQKIETIQKYPFPTNLKELRSFLGLVNYCREYVRLYSELTGPFFNLLKGETKTSVKRLEWSESLHEKFVELKQALSGEIKNKQPDFTKEFILTPDASSLGIGAVLAQADENGREEVVSLFSKRFDKCQENYSVTDKELLAVVKGIANYRHYLLGKEFVLRTDHKALTYLWECKNPTSRILRWAMQLQEYKFKIVYIKGEDNIADGCSRIFAREERISAIITDFSEEQKNKILLAYHLETGHGSANNMKFLIKGKYFWPGIYQDIDKLTSECQICLKSGFKIRNTRNRVLVTSRFNELWEVDLIGRIPHLGGNCFILVAQDHYSKWVETKVLGNKEGETVTKAIEEIIIGKHGVPIRILSDCGLEFKNRHVSNLVQRHGLKWEYSSPEHHNTVGSVERVNQTLWSKIKKLTNFGESSWKNAVSKATLAVNISFNRAIGTSPHILVWAKSPELNVDLEFGRQPIRFKRSDLSREREIHFEKYKKSIVKGSISAPDNFEIGEKVLIFRENISDKLKSNWHGGYEITDKIFPDAFMVKRDKTLIRVNKSQIKRDLSFQGREMS